MEQLYRIRNRDITPGDLDTVAEIAGMAGNSRDIVRTFCSSVLGVRICLGTLQKFDRPHDRSHLPELRSHRRQGPLRSHQLPR